MPGQRNVTTPADAEEADYDEPPGRNCLGAARERGDERKHAVDQRKGSVKQDQGHQGQSGPGECENAEDDGGDPPQQQDPPGLGKRVQHRAVG